MELAVRLGYNARPWQAGYTRDKAGIAKMMRAVQRTFAIFDCFTSERTSLTLQEIADQIKLPKSTTFRFVQSLDDAG